MTTNSSNKLYLVTRANLKPGQQASQLAHVSREFQEEWPDIERSWYKESNTIVLLSVANEHSLRELVSKANELGIKTATFREPDLKNALTAIALEPCEKSASLCRGITTALRNTYEAHGLAGANPNGPGSLVLKATASNAVIPGENPGQGALPLRIWERVKGFFC